jgi:hypothetical protein
LVKKNSTAVAFFGENEGGSSWLDDGAVFGRAENELIGFAGDAREPYGKNRHEQSNKCRVNGAIILDYISYTHL